MKILTVVGARPQFIKAAPVSKALRDAGHHEFLVHTGQHYDHAMSQIFFDELGIPEPDVNLGVGSGLHGKQTGEMLMRLEEVIQEQKSDWVLVYGDTNSTLAGALAAVKLHMPVAHVEAGLRSFNREMPEEHNRVLTDHCADLLFCPTQTAANQLAREGILKGVHCVGDTMVDAILQFSSTAAQRSDILDRYGLSPKRYALATIHRPYNTDVAEQLSGILAAFGDLDDIVVFPAHPRTAKRIFELRINLPDNVRLLEPIGYLDMLWLEQNSRLIMTDSGGIQKEAFVFGVPCITLRTETEWMETVESGWNVLAHTDPQRIVELAKHTQWPVPPPKPVFGRGHAAVDVVRILASAEM